MNIVGVKERFPAYKRLFCTKYSREDPRVHARINKALRLSGCVIKRDKETAWKDAPEKETKLIKINLSNSAEYAKAQSEFVEWYIDALTSAATDRAEIDRRLDAAMRAETLVKIGKLRQLTAAGKTAETCKVARDILETTNDSVVIFGVHTAALNKIQETLGCNIITGETPQKERFSMIQKINNGETRVLILSTQCGSVGLNITGANHVIFHEYSWTDKDHTQSEARAHRMGQKKNVSVYYIHAEKSTDDWMKSLVESKGQLNSGATATWLIQNAPDRKEEIEKAMTKMADDNNIEL